MKTVFSKSLIALATAASLATPMLAYAESSTQSAMAGPLTATARLDFRINIPKVLFLRVGTGGVFGGAANATIDLIDFTVPAANLGDGTDIAGVGGDVGGGAVTALLRSNADTVTLTATTTGDMDNGALDTIPWSEILVVNSVSTVAPLVNTFPHLAVLPTGAASANFAPAPVGKLTNVASTWTFTYSNTNTVPAGIYGGAANNGRVVYTASVL